MPQHDTDVLVIGAGLVGAACALRLADAGRQVCLVDAQVPQQAASFGNAGHIATEQRVPMANAQVLRASWSYLRDADGPLRLRAAYLLPLLPWLARFVWAARPSALARGIAALMALQQTALDDLADLMAQAGIGGLLHRDGYLRIWESDRGEQTALAQAREMAALGVPSDVVAAAGIHAEAPGLNAEVRGGICYSGTGHVADPQAVCDGLVVALQRAGGQLQQAQVTRLAPSEDAGYVASLQGGGRIHARQVLLCAGAWSAPLAAGLGYRVPLDTERGYHINVPWPAAADPMLAQLRLRRPIASIERNVIMTPMLVGLRMTGTVEFGGLDLPPDPHRYRLLHRSMRALLPGIDTTQSTEWMGFRPSLPDHLPVLGAAPRHPGVFFAFGHQHLGLTLCGVSARVMATLMQGGVPSIDLAPYRVDRW
ncbi:MAG: FAD-binding oxidoreductase [Betaproteobacteria bacterium]